MPKYIDFNDESDEDTNSHTVIPIDFQNQIIIYLACNCAIVSPIDINTLISNRYYCTECDKYQNVLATVRHFIR